MRKPKHELKAIWKVLISARHSNLRCDYSTYTFHSFKSLFPRFSRLSSARGLFLLLTNQPRIECATVSKCFIVMLEREMMKCLLAPKAIKTGRKKAANKALFGMKNASWLRVASRWICDSQPIIRDCRRRRSIWLCIIALLLFCLHFFLTFFSDSLKHFLHRLLFLALSDIFCSRAENAINWSLCEIAVNRLRVNREHGKGIVCKHCRLGEIFSRDFFRREISHHFMSWECNLWFSSFVMGNVA